jgi:VCBS repeat-containing protein
MSTSGIHGNGRWFRAAVLALIFIVALVSVAGARVWTDQEDYAPGSVVIISGDNSDDAGFLPGETVIVSVSGPNGYAETCEAVADAAGAWSCQVTLWDDETAVGDYVYTAAGQTSGVTQSGQFTDGAAEYHTCALTEGGGVKCWGYNPYGQVGDGTTTQRLTPVDVLGLGSSAAQIGAGGYHTCALMKGGGVKCWGYNGNGQLGDGTTTRRLTPVDVMELGSGVAQVSAGSSHTCALMEGGGVKCWGYNYYGQLGDNTTTNRLTPVDVMGLSSGATQISAGVFHTCALMESGGVKCWGRNDHGQLGDGTTTRHLTPVDVMELGSGVAQVSAGILHTCALMESGGVKCWGYNFYGQLGDGTTTQRLMPVDVLGLGSSAAQISAGILHTCALTEGGGVKCWGYNLYGQLGDGTTTQRLTPVEVVELSSGAAQVSASKFHTCALTEGGGVKCWGWNGNGQLGDGTTTQRLMPVDVVGLTSGAIALPDYYGRANQPPVAVNDAYTTAEDQTLLVAAPGVLGNDVDSDNDLLAAILVAGVEHGALTLESDGSFTYTPEADYHGPDSFTYKANDGTADSNIATVSITVDPVNDLPVVAWLQSPAGPAIIGETAVAAVATFSDVDVGDSHTCAWNWGDGVVDGPVTCAPGNHSGSHVYSAVGAFIVTFTVTDSGPAAVAVTAPVDVIWPFAGFFPPVDNPPVLNSVKAGSAVPVKFSLGGDYGLAILAAGYPQSVRITCDAAAPQEDIDETVTAGGSSLQYDPLTGQYSYVWKTNKAWAKTCRQFQLELVDGTTHVANFKFK